MKDVLQVGLEIEVAEELAIALVSLICPTKPPATSSLTDEVVEKFLLEADVDCFPGLAQVLLDFATIREVLQPSTDQQHQTSFALAVQAQKVAGGKRAADTVLSAFALSKFGKAKLKDVSRAIEMDAVAKAKSSAADHALKAVQDMSVTHGQGTVSSDMFREFDSKASVLAASSGTAGMAKSAWDVLTACVACVLKDFAELINIESEEQSNESYKAITDMKDVLASLDKSWRTWHTETQQKILEDENLYATCPALHVSCHVILCEDKICFASVTK